MDFQDRFTPGQIRGLYGYLTVETPRAHKRRVQDIRTVGSSDNDQVCIVLKTVHFYQKLVEGLFTLIHSAGSARTATASNSIDLINEDDRGCSLLGFLEQVTDTRSTKTHKHLNEI